MFPLNVPLLARVVCGGKADVFAYVTLESDEAANVLVNEIF